MPLKCRRSGVGDPLCHIKSSVFPLSKPVRRVRDTVGAHDHTTSVTVRTVLTLFYDSYWSLPVPNLQIHFYYGYTSMGETEHLCRVLYYLQIKFSIGGPEYAPHRCISGSGIHTLGVFDQQIIFKYWIMPSGKMRRKYAFLHMVNGRLFLVNKYKVQKSALTLS